MSTYNENVTRYFDLRKKLDEFAHMLKEEKSDFLTQYMPITRDGLNGLINASTAIREIRETLKGAWERYESEVNVQK